MSRTSTLPKRLQPMLATQNTPYGKRCMLQRVILPSARKLDTSGVITKKHANGDILFQIVACVSITGGQIFSSSGKTNSAEGWCQKLSLGACRVVLEKPVTSNLSHLIA
jgi:hypothetical protein